LAAIDNAAVVPAAQREYRADLCASILAARGKFIVMEDAE